MAKATIYARQEGDRPVEAVGNEGSPDPQPRICLGDLRLYPAKGNLASALVSCPIVGEDHPLGVPVDHEFPFMRRDL